MMAYFLAHIDNNCKHHQNDVVPASNAFQSEEPDTMCTLWPASVADGPAVMKSRRLISPEDVLMLGFLVFHCSRKSAAAAGMAAADDVCRSTSSGGYPPVEGGVLTGDAISPLATAKPPARGATGSSYRMLSPGLMSLLTAAAAFAFWSGLDEASSEPDSCELEEAACGSMNSTDLRLEGFGASCVNRLFLAEGVSCRQLSSSWCCTKGFGGSEQQI